MIGNFLRNLYKSLGYNVVGINYLGDWGKQYGKLWSFALPLWTKLTGTRLELFLTPCTVQVCWPSVSASTVPRRSW
jgi:hypothetical protein